MGPLAAGSKKLKPPRTVGGTRARLGRKVKAEQEGSGTAYPSDRGFKASLEPYHFAVTNINQRVQSSK